MLRPRPGDDLPPLAQPPPETADDSGPTSNPRLWVFSENERLALIVLSRRYLSYDAHAQPLSWGQAAKDLAAITELLLTTTLVPPDLAEIDVLKWCGLARAQYYRGRWSFPR